MKIQFQLSLLFTLPALLALSCMSNQPLFVGNDGGTGDDSRTSALIQQDATLWCQKQVQCGEKPSLADCLAARAARPFKCTLPDDQIMACLGDVATLTCSKLTTLAGRSCVPPTRVWTAVPADGGFQS